MLCRMLLPPAKKLGQGNIYSSFLITGGSAPLHVGIPPQEQSPPKQTPPGPDTPQSRPPGAVHAGRYEKQADGTHPTGMHTCYKNMIIEKFKYSTSLFKLLLGILHKL